MSEENLEAARRAIESPVEVFFGLFDDQIICDARWWRDMPVDGAPVAVGRENVERVFRRWWGTFDHYAVVGEEYVDVGPFVVTAIYEHGKGKNSGIPFERRHVQVYTFRNGKIVNIAMFSTREDAFEALGLSPGD